MVIVSTSEFRDSQKKFFDLAEHEKVLVKRGKKYINLFVTDTPENNNVNESWIKEFLAIPAEYRCNPFEVSPSGDLFYADKRNIEQINKALEQVRKGQVKKLSKEKQEELFG
jgi:hypothetical protein